MKFHININHLLEQYRTQKKNPTKFLCTFIFYNYLPYQSIKNFIFFMFCANYNNQFLEEIKKLLDRQHYKVNVLEELIHDHPDFQHIIYENKTQYRIAFLEKLLDLHPNLTITIEYGLI